MDTYSSIEQLLLAFDKTQRFRYASLILSLVTLVISWAIILVIKQNMGTDYSFYAVIPTVVLMIYFLLKAWRKIDNEEQKILNKIIRERYYENYLSVIPEGSSHLEKFLSIAKEIFPQIKEALKDSKNITSKSNLIEINYKSKRIIIQQFSDSFSMDEFKKIIKMSRHDDVYRHIIIGINLTNVTQDKSFEKIMQDVTKVDLVTIDDDDFKMEWIS